MSRNLLILDDQEDILLILEREFRKRPGLTVSSASKVADALRLIPEKRIELLISDVRLGVDSGFDLVRTVKRSYPDVGTILMSAYRSPSNRAQAEELGVYLFLEKPFQIAKLVEEVENYFQRREMAASIPEEVVETPAATATETSELAHFKPQDLVQLFCLNGRNVVLSVFPAAGQPYGNIYIQRGRVLHADFEGKTGNEAFYDLINLRNSSLKVKDWTEPVPVTIETNWEHLLLEAAVQQDEQAEQDAGQAATTKMPDIRFGG